MEGRDPVYEVYKRLESNHIHWDFNELRRLKPSNHTEESLMETWRSISGHIASEKRRGIEDLIHSTCSSEDVVARIAEEICNGQQRCTTPAYAMVAVYYLLAGDPIEIYLRNVFEIVIGYEKERMFETVISQDPHQKSLQCFWRYRLGDEVGFESSDGGVIRRHNVLALDRFRGRPGNVLETFYSVFTPKHMARVLVDLMNSRDATVREALKLLANGVHNRVDSAEVL